MKKVIIICSISFLGTCLSLKVNAQADELAQLALDIEKLAQFKQILSDLKKGYEIVFGGYNTIKNISKGNFELHKVFLNGLLEVNPAVKNYKRVADIINFQIRLVKEYKVAYNRFKQQGWFGPGEIDYMGKVYGNLFNLSLKSLDDLFTVTTSSKLRMSDDERIAAIDTIFADMQDKLSFLRSFNNSNSILAAQRSRETNELKNVSEYFKMK
ncbi:MAG: TerB family tellurite resistance protein [Ferruginibacter sp.]